MCLSGRHAPDAAGSSPVTAASLAMGIEGTADQKLCSKRADLHIAIVLLRLCIALLQLANKWICVPESSLAV